MKKLILLIFIISVVGCTGDRWKRPEDDDNGKTVMMGINVIVVNGCQYVLWRKMKSSAMVHAGNCNNPEHKVLKWTNAADADRGGMVIDTLKSKWTVGTAVEWKTSKLDTKNLDK